jgi:omega-amidase
MQPLELALIQTSTHWHAAQQNRDMFDEWFNQVPQTARVVVLPEMFTTGFTMSSDEVAEPMDGATLAWLARWSRELDAVICGSAAIRVEGRIYNRMVWMPPSGKATVYDKRHLFRMAQEHQHYAPGTDRVVVEFDGWRVCLLVCYDLRFPVWFRNRRDYDVYLCVANWPRARRDAWSTLLRARAIENQAYAVGCNVIGTDGNGIEYAGGSAAYAPDGKTLVEAGENPDLIRVVLDADALTELRDGFPVWQDADDYDLKTKAME